MTVLDMYKGHETWRTKYFAQLVVNQNVKPSGLTYKLKNKMKELSDKRYLAYLEIFEESDIDFKKIYTMYNDVKFKHYQLLPIYDELAIGNKVPEGINDPKNILQSWCDSYMASGYTREGLEAFYEELLIEAELLDKALPKLDEELAANAKIVDAAHQANAPVKQYISEQKIAFPNDFSEHFSHVQRTIIEMMNDPRYYYQDEIDLYDAYLDREIVLSRKKYDAFIQQFGTSSENQLLAGVNSRIRIRRDRALDLDLFLVSQADVYSHVYTKEDLRIPTAYTGAIYLVGMDIDTHSGKVMAMRCSFEEGLYLGDEEMQFESEVEDFDDFFDGAPIVLVESGDIREIGINSVESFEFLEDEDFTFEDQKEAFWDRYWVSDEEE